MRRIVPALAAVAMLAAFAGPALAAVEVRIGGFPFQCKTPDGNTVYPKFGDIPSSTYRLPDQRESCLKAIDNHIHGCDLNTDFALKSSEERYPGCLPIFDEQAKKCIAFYHNERAKCDAGGAGGAARAGDGAGGRIVAGAARRIKRISEVSVSLVGRRTTRNCNPGMATFRA